MTVLFESGYSVGANQPLTHARIAHSYNWKTGGSVTSSATETGYSNDAADNTLTYDRWKPSGLAATWTYTFAGSTSFDYCAIAAHTMGTNGNTLQVQVDNSGAWDNLIPATAITSDAPIFCIFSTQTDTAARIRITNGTAPEIGVIKFGTALQMPRPIFGGHRPFDFTRQPILQANKSATGEFLGRSVIGSTYGNAFDWQHLEYSWVSSNWPDFQRAAQDEPFFVAWRPDGTYGHVAFGQTDEVPIPQTMGIRDLMSVSLQVDGHGYD